jgi:hypothetical protein
MGFFDVLAVDQRTVAGVEIANNQRAVDLADLAMDSAYPSVIHTNIGLGVSTNDNRQFVQDESGFGAAVVEANQFRFHGGFGAREAGCLFRRSGVEARIGPVGEA